MKLLALFSFLFAGAIFAADSNPPAKLVAQVAKITPAASPHQEAIDEIQITIDALKLGNSYCAERFAFAHGIAEDEKNPMDLRNRANHVAEDCVRDGVEIRQVIGELRRKLEDLGK